MASMTVELAEPKDVKVAKFAGRNRTVVALRRVFGDYLNDATHVLIKGHTLPIRGDGRVEVTHIVTREELVNGKTLRVLLLNISEC